MLTGDTDNWPAQVMELTHGVGVDLAVDQLGGDVLIACLRSLAPMGQVVSINVMTGMPTQDVFKEMPEHLRRQREQLRTEQGV